jgi:L-gulonate 5-dehydrogenase
VKAWFLTGSEKLELRDIPKPIPGPGEALIRVRAVGICGSDSEAYQGIHPLPNYPRLPGHEFAGEVAAVPADWSGPPVGTRVAVDPALHCGTCYACRIGRHNCCTNVSIAGVHRPGAMAEFTTARATQLAPIPDDMSFATAGVVETLSIGAQAVGRANVLEGDRVVVLGAGSIGLCCLLMARRAGAAVLVSEPLPWRRALAAEFGAERITDPADADLADAVRDFSDGYGAHVAIDATGEIEGAEAALAVAGSAARVVVLTLHDKPIRVRPWQLVRQELTLLGSRLSLADFGELVGLAASGDAPIDRLVTHTFPMSEAAAAFAAAAARPTGFVKAVVLPQE